MKQNGQVDNVEIIPDLENEMVEATPTPATPKSGGCGCSKNKGAISQTPMPVNTNKYNWTKIGLVVAGLILAYFVFFKKKGKIEVPKIVEPPEV